MSYEQEFMKEFEAWVNTQIMINDMAHKESQKVYEEDQDLATVCADWQPYPQTMINVRIQKGQKWQEASKDVLAEVEKELEGKGRVVLRASGTEPVVRVMVEARQADWAKKGAERIAAAITGKQ